VKKFANPANAIVHLRAHTQEKIYKCHTCTHAFCDASTLKKHLRVHSGDRPFSCSICAKGFTQSGNLKRHMLLHQKNNVPSETYSSSLENKIYSYESQTKYEPTTQPVKHDFQFEHTIKNEYNFVNTQLSAGDHLKRENLHYMPSYLSQASQYHPNTSSYICQASF
jgi:uncharacterized Zn-finger protein